MLVASISLLVLGLATPLDATQASDGESRHQLLELWLDAVTKHVPGDDDRLLAVASGWSRPQLLLLRADIEALFALARDPKVRRFVFMPSDALRQEFQSHFRRPPVLVYDGPFLERLRPLAVVVRGAGVSAFSQRAALLHTDVVVNETAVASTVAPRKATGLFRVFLEDARLTGIADSSMHWELARFLVGRTASAPTTWMRDWYRATVSYLLFSQQYGSEHVRQALIVFPDDAHMLLLAGAEHEARASATVQSFRAATDRDAIRLPILPSNHELEQAERHLVEAIRHDPDLVEARVRLGHVLVQRGRHEESIAHLRTAVRDGREPLMTYYGNLLLGAALTASGDREGARHAFERASALVPAARLPHLALAESAFRFGEEEERTRRLRLALAADHAEDEPWFRYYQAAGRHADLLLRAVRHSAIGARP